MFVNQSAELDRAQRLLPGFVVSDERFKREKISILDGVSFLREVNNLFEYAAYSRKERQAVLVRVIGYPILAITLAAVIGRAAPIVAGALAMLAEYLVICSRVRHRTESFEKDYTAFLPSLSSAVRTGLDPIAAMCGSETLFQTGSQISKEIVRFREDIEAGVPEEKALHRFAVTISHPDIHLFRTAMILARREGSSLAQCLRRLARVTRQRQTFRRKIRTAITMQKMSANGTVACTIIIGFIQYGANPQAIDTALKHPMGSKMIYLGMFLLLSGVVWMRRLAKGRI